MVTICKLVPTSNSNILYNKAYDTYVMLVSNGTQPVSLTNTLTMPELNLGISPPSVALTRNVY